MNLVRRQQTPTRDYDCTLQAGSLGFRVLKEREKTRVELTIRTGAYESKIKISPRQAVGLRMLLSDYLNHLGGEVDGQV